MNFYFEGYWHHKNLNGLKLMINEGMCVDFTFNRILEAKPPL